MPTQPLHPLPPPLAMVETTVSSPPPLPNSGSSAGVLSKVRKKIVGSRLWMRFDRFGQSEVLECDKSVIIKRAAIPARDLRILGPVFSHSASILGIVHRL